MTITPEQLNVFHTHPNSTLRLVDPATHGEYVLLRADNYDRLRESQDNLDPKSSYAAIDQAFAEGWNDPKMDDYDRYEELKK